jgi:hypothetical protein
MKTLKEHISIEKASEGMVLARDIQGEAGSVLIAAGTSLTPQLIESLRRKDVRSVCVEAGTERDFSDNEIEAMEEALREEVISRFRKEPAGPVMEGIFRAVLRMEAMRRLDSEKKR